MQLTNIVCIELFSYSIVIGCCRFIDVMECERIVVKCFQSSHEVSSFRAAKLSDDFYATKADVERKKTMYAGGNMLNRQATRDGSQCKRTYMYCPKISLLSVIQCKLMVLIQCIVLFCQYMAPRQVIKFIHSVYSIEYSGSISRWLTINFQSVAPGLWHYGY